MALFAVAVFVVVLALFALEVVHRTPAVLGGAALLIIAGAIAEEEAVEAVNWETLGLLVGMMILVGILKHTGLFTYLAIRSAQLARGSPGRVLVYLGLVTAVLSAFLDNVTTVLLLFPVTLVIARILDQDPLPFLLVEVLASNIGGTATLIGDPPNIIIGTATGLSFNSFIVNLTPPVAATLALTLAILWVVYGRRMRASEEQRKGVMAQDARAAIRDRKLLVRAGLVTTATVGAFFLQDLTGLGPAVVALAGAALAMIVCGTRVEQCMEEVEWPTILFFVGLFVMVGALEATGVVGAIADALASASDSRAATAALIIWGSGAASAVIDNIPFTATMIPVIQELAQAENLSRDQLRPLWWSLAIGADFGGNATLIGASANVVVAGMSERAGQRISFLKFMAYGIPVTLISLAVATPYVALRYYLL